MFSSISDSHQKGSGYIRQNCFDHCIDEESEYQRSPRSRFGMLIPWHLHSSSFRFLLGPRNVFTWSDMKTFVESLTTVNHGCYPSLLWLLGGSGEHSEGIWLWLGIGGMCLYGWQAMHVLPGQGKACRNSPTTDWANSPCFVTWSCRATSCITV